MYIILLNMYKDVKSCITYNYCKSDYFNCDMGVRHLENIYPFLFAMFLNDLQMFFENASLNGLEYIYFIWKSTPLQRGQPLPG